MSAEGSPVPVATKKKAAASKIKSVDIRGDIEESIAPPKEELEKIKERAIKKVTKKVKAEGKEIIKEVTKEATKKALDRFDHEQAPEIVSFLPASNAIGMRAVDLMKLEPEELAAKVFNLPPPPPPTPLKDQLPSLDQLTYVVMTPAELEHHSLKMYAMGAITGFAVYYLSSRLCKMLFGTSSAAGLACHSSVAEKFCIEE